MFNSIYVLFYRFKPSLAAIKATSKTSVNSQYRNDVSIQLLLHDQLIRVLRIDKEKRASEF